MPDLDFTIRTRAELAGAEQTAASLEMQIGKAKALGQDYSALAQQLNRVNESLAGVNPILRQSGEEAEHAHLSHRGLHILFNEMGQQSVPAFGHALAGALYGPLGLAIALGAAIRGVQEASAQAAEKARKLDEILESGSMETATTAADDYASALSRHAIESDNYAAALEKIRTAQDGIKEETDSSIKKLHEEATALNAVQKAQTEAAKAKIEAMAESGQISPEEKIRRLAELENNASAEKLAHDRQLRAQELAGRRGELIQTAAAAAAAQAAVPAAQTAMDAGEDAKKLREAKVAEWKKKIEEAEKKNKEIVDLVGPIGFSDNSKTAFTSKLPGASSDEAKLYQKAKAEYENNLSTINVYKPILEKFENVATVVETDRNAEKAKKNYEETAKKAEDLTARVEKLKKEIADLAQSNQIKDSSEQTVTALDQQTRDTKAGAEIGKENARTLHQDVETIHNYEKTATVDPVTIRKAANAISELSALLNGNHELLAQLAGLGSSVKDIAAAQQKVVEETKLARELAQRALDHSNNP